MRDILEKLLPYYEDTLKKLDSIQCLSQAKDYLKDRGMLAGICRCASRVFNEEIYGEEWVNELANHKILGCKYWAAEPSRAEDMDELVSSIQIRIDMMRKLLQP